MRGLSDNIKNALNTVIDGLSYMFVDEDIPEGMPIEKIILELDSDRMKAIMEAKVSSFKTAKAILNKWISSPNAPSKKVIKDYLEKLISSGEEAQNILNAALSSKIDYSELEPHKHNAAVKAKEFILDAIFSLDASLIELRNKLESGDFDFSDKEFKIGFPELYAKGGFFPIEKYFKKWYNEKEDAVNICPFSSQGEIITISDLKIQLPKVPKKRDILFHDLPQEEQFWRRQEVPANITPDNVEQWTEYILEEYRRRREGIWFMNNGEPVYLTGNHYFALQWCVMFDNGGFMDFRLAQLEMFYHLEACIIDNRCLGQVFVKSRRTGFTYVVLFILLNMSTSKRNGKFGMTSKTGADVQEAFDKFSYAFLNLPFYFRPVVRGKEDSPTELFFGKPSNNTKEAKKSRKTGVENYLNTVVDHRPTKNGSYDSIKLDGYLGDEAAKWEKPNDYITHLGMVAPTMMPAGKVVGKAFIGSTMGSREKGGKQFAELIAKSKISDRDPITQKTPTALYYHFLPAHHNMDEFTDKYGKCHTERPETETKNVYGDIIKFGSEEYLMAVEEQKKKQSDKAYNEQLRTYPRTLEHALRDESNDCVFNLSKLYEQIDHNEKVTEEYLYTRGNFRWVGAKDSDVEFYPDPNGRFKVAWIPSKIDGTEYLKNNVREENGKFYPNNTDLMRFGCDPFSVMSTHGEGSKGALHGLTLKVSEGNAPNNEFVVEYVARPQNEFIFFEDVIMCIRFYGSPILVESNRIDLLRHMKNRGYRGFSMDRLDREPKKLNQNEKTYGGQVMSGQDILDSHMNSIATWIEDYVGEYTDDSRNVRPIGEMGCMPFSDTLRDWMGFDPKNRTKFDATISSGLAIMACNKDKYRKNTREVKVKDFSGVFKKYNNKGNLSKFVKS